MGALTNYNKFVDITYSDHTVNDEVESIIIPAWLPRVSVVIPTLNEALNLPYVLPLIPSWVYEIIVVDGYSTDGTVNIARDLRPEIRVLMQEGKGKGDALKTGFKAAEGDIIVMLDADGSHNPVEIAGFVGALMVGADFAKGTRFIQGGGTVDMEWYRRFGNWGLMRIVRLLYGGQYTDLCYGYDAFWRSVLSRIQPDSPGFEIETLMNIRALKARLRITEVPSFEAERINGQSNLNTFRDGWRVLKTILREKFKPTRLHAIFEEIDDRPPLEEFPLAFHAALAVNGRPRA